MLPVVERQNPSTVLLPFHAPGPTAQCACRLEQRDRMASLAEPGRRRQACPAGSDDRYAQWAHVLGTPMARAHPGPPGDPELTQGGERDALVQDTKFLAFDLV